jgi:hypothetical protein
MIMRKTRIIALSAALAAGLSTPAWAAWDRIGAIDVSYRQDRDSASPNFGGPVERLQFTARGSDIKCGFIRTTFRNGKTRLLYSGVLRRNVGRNVDLPGDARDVRRIDTKCHALNRGNARIEIAADIGRYRDAWRNSPDWARMWAAVFNWTNTQGNAIDNAVNYWVSITTLHFAGKNDTDGSATGWAGRSINSIGLKPLNADARCSRINVVFGSGRKLDLADRGALHEGATARFDLPGADRDVVRLNLACRALNRNSVDIQVYGNK